jgi:hypothetical protein
MALLQYIKRRHLAQKNFRFDARVKKCHFGNLSGWLCPGSAALKNPLLDLGSYELLAMLGGKIRKCSFFLGFNLVK